MDSYALDADDSAQEISPEWFGSRRARCHSENFTDAIGVDRRRLSPPRKPPDPLGAISRKWRQSDVGPVAFDLTLKRGLHPLVDLFSSPCTTTQSRASLFPLTILLYRNACECNHVKLASTFAELGH